MAPSGLVEWPRQQLAKLSYVPEDVDIVDKPPTKKPKLRSVPLSPQEPQRDESSSALLDALKVNGVKTLANPLAWMANGPPATRVSTSMTYPATLPTGTVPASTGGDELLDSENEALQP